MKWGFSPWVSMTKTYFVTADAYMHQNLFQAEEAANLLVATVLKYGDAGEFQIHEYVIMPNHSHFLLSVDEDHSLPRAMQLIKGGYSHALRGIGIHRKAVWQPGYYERRVRDFSEYCGFRDYIHKNPVRRGLAEKAAHYRFSSAAELVRLDEVPAGLKPQVLETELTRA